MPLQQQAVFALAVGQRLSYAEIARRLDIDEDTIKLDIRDGLRSMRQAAMNHLAVLGAGISGGPNSSNGDRHISVDAPS